MFRIDDELDLRERFINFYFNQISGIKAKAILSSI